MNIKNPITATRLIEGPGYEPIAVTVGKCFPRHSSHRCSSCPLSLPCTAQEDAYRSEPVCHQCAPGSSLCSIHTGHHFSVWAVFFMAHGDCTWNPLSLSPFSDCLVGLGSHAQEDRSPQDHSDPLSGRFLKHGYDLEYRNYLT